MWQKLFNLTKIRSCKCYLMFLNCIAMLKTVQSKKEDATRVIYEFELSVLKNIDRHGKRSTNLKKKVT